MPTKYTTYKNKKRKTRALMAFFSLLVAYLLLPKRSFAHPHVFIDAKVHMRFDKEGCLQSIIEDWRYDPIFSASVIVDFAHTNHKTFTPAERKKLTNIIHNSVAYYHYFQTLLDNGKKIAMAPPYAFSVDFHKVLETHVENKPMQPFKFEKGHHYMFRLSDPTFFVYIDYKKDSDVRFTNLPPYCKVKIIRPNANEVLKKDQALYTEDFFTDPSNALDVASQLANRLEFSC